MKQFTQNQMRKFIRRMPDDCWLTNANGAIVLFATPAVARNVMKRKLAQQDIIYKGLAIFTGKRLVINEENLQKLMQKTSIERTALKRVK